MKVASSNTPALDYKQLFGTLPGLFLILSPDLIILEATEAYLKATLTKREDIVGGHLFDVFPESPATAQVHAVENMIQSLQHVLTLRTPHTMPVQRYDIPRPANLGGGFEERYWLTSHTPVLDARGELQYIIHQPIDVTMQQMAQHHIHTNRERIEILAQATTDVIWDLDLLSDFIWWNDSLKQVFGYDAYELTNTEDWARIIHPEDQQRVISGINATVKQGGRLWTDSYRLRRKNGTYANVMERGYILRDEKGIGYRMVGSMFDITEQIEAEHNLQESNTRLRNLIEALPCPAWTTSSAGESSFLNQAWQDLVGQPLVGPAEITNFIHPEDMSGIVALWENSRQTGNSYENEFRIKTRDGSYEWFSAKAVPLYNSQGEITIWLGTCFNIHNQKLIQEKLLAKDKFLERVLSLAPVHFGVLKGPEHLVEYISPGLQKLQKNPEVAGKPLALAWPELQERGFMEIIDTVYRTGTPFHRQEALFKKSSRGTTETEPVFLNFTYQPLPAEDGSTEGVVITASDVTEQVNARQAAEDLYYKLQQSNGHIEQLLEAQPLMTWTTLPDGMVNYANQNWHKFSGSTLEETQGTGWINYIHPDDLQETLSKWANSCQTGQEFAGESRWLSTRDQKYYWFLVRAAPIRKPDGQITLWVGTHTNIQELKEMQGELLRSKEQFEFLADTIPQMVWTAQPDGFHDYFNKRWIEYTNFTLAECQGKSRWFDLLHPEDRERTMEHWQQTLLSGKYYENECRLRDKSGNYRWFLCQAMPMRTNSGQILKWFGTCTDIEDHKRAEETLLAKNAELRKTNQDLDSFVYTASHDLKLPIINIETIFRELVGCAEFKDPDAEKLVMHFNKSLRQIFSTINDLAQVVKTQENHEHGPDFVNLKEITKAVKTSIKELVTSTNTSIETDFKEAPVIWFSRANLQSIIYNLVTNSIKYAAPGRAPEIRLKTTIEGNYTVLTITDNGLGIDLKKHSEKLFQMYRRFHNHVPGSGLGLYIVHRILANNGGRIELESCPNEGTTFRLHFKNKPVETAI